MTHYFEIAMLICFGLSWPANITKSIRSGTAKGKSVLFEIMIIVGYLCGVAGKLFGGDVSYVLLFYALDILMVATDLVLTLRNRKRDKAAENK